MGWKLFTRDEGIRPPGEGSDDHDSKDAAMRRACDIIQHQRHVKIDRIEGPNGEQIGIEEIEAWCKSALSKKIPE